MQALQKKWLPLMAGVAALLLVLLFRQFSSPLEQTPQTQSGGREVGSNSLPPALVNHGSAPVQKGGVPDQSDGGDLRRTPAIVALQELVQFFRQERIEELIPIHSESSRGSVPANHAGIMDPLIHEFSKAALASPGALEELISFVKSQDETTRMVAALFLLDRAVVHREPFFDSIDADEFQKLMIHLVSAKDKWVKRLAARAIVVSRNGMVGEEGVSQLVRYLSVEPDLPTVRNALPALGLATKSPGALAYLSQLALQSPPTPNHELMQLDALWILSGMGHKNDASAIVALNLLERGNPATSLVVVQAFFRPVDPVDGSAVDLTGNNPLAMRFVERLERAFLEIADQEFRNAVVGRVADFDGPQAVDLGRTALFSEHVGAEVKVKLLQDLYVRMNPHSTRLFKYSAKECLDLVRSVAQNSNIDASVAVGAYGLLCNLAIAKVEINRSLAQAEFDGLLEMIRGDGRKAVSELEESFVQRGIGAGLLRGR